ncbi:LLM class flavin-dependent oxidoreductase [Ktedonospora formicarum]|uniref:Luciferase-like protein n=1 Tax=Ktedonospora formicarum TaxID=2778364 RepID=A0A8J3HUH1_9CHLR|nr:LLM class flavin-dependent oxidoreductase [Ktedonospora formicarum]GHO42211.1 luciferase-like protein [Ktedonospora formicarum]
MHYGLVLPNIGKYSDARVLAELAHAAEGAGWEGFFLPDTLHFGSYSGTEAGLICDPWIALAAIAMRTKRIKLGLLVAAVPRRRPWKMARETVTLDHLSQGRFILGVGIGAVFDRGFDAFGEELDIKKRAGMLDESLAILEGLWSGQPFSYSGEYYHVQKITFVPKPVQAPRIPIWVAGIWPRKGPMERAARYDGVYPVTLTASGIPRQLTSADIGKLKRWMDEHRTNPAPFDIVANGPVFNAVQGVQSREVLQSITDAGATWCLQNIQDEQDVDAVRVSILQSPPSL